MGLYATCVVNAFRTSYSPGYITNDPPAGFQLALDLLEAEGYMEGPLWSGSDTSFEDLTDLAFADHPDERKLILAGLAQARAGAKAWRCAHGPAHRHSIPLGQRHYVVGS